VCGVFTDAVDIMKLISDRGYPTVASHTLLGTSTIIQCYPLVRAFLDPPPELARGSLPMDSLHKISGFGLSLLTRRNSCDISSIP